MTFETPRLRMRPHRSEDFDRYWRMIRDPIGRRFAGGTTAWGRGYAAEAAQGLLSRLPPGEIFAAAERENAASARVLCKLGF